MVRQKKKRGRPVSGWLILDKPKGLGSTEAVSRIKWLYQAEKAGHAGTLDPLASGLLPIALGEATKTVPYVVEGKKKYQFTVKWGEERSTDDLEGEITKKTDQRPTEEQIRNILPAYMGTILQTPPQFSAIKINGVRAYDLARNGENVVISPRLVQIETLDYIESASKDVARFSIECGKGTYIRSLIRDIGRDLGCYGHIIELHRSQVIPFTEDHFVSLNVLETLWENGLSVKEEGETTNKQNDYRQLDALLVKTSVALEALPQYAASDKEAERIRLGNKIILRGSDDVIEAEELCVRYKGRAIAIGFVEKGTFQPKRVFTSD